ncbi:MAG: hypothetical protein ACRDTH_12800 [Pseudonocardiaceae bacterium]
MAATRHIVADPDLVGRVRVLVLTTYELDEYGYDALRAGAWRWSGNACPTPTSAAGCSSAPRRSRPTSTAR